MQATNNSKSHQALSALALGLGSATMLSFGFANNNPMPIVGGGLMGAAAYGMQRRHKLTGADYQDGLGELAQCLDSTAELIESGSTATGRAVLKYVPEKYRPALEAKIEAYQDMSWAPAMRRRSKMVLGASGSGKTIWELYEVYGFITDNPEGKIVICDENYGKQIFGDIPNTWLNLPKDLFIRDDAPSIFDAINEYWTELQRRKKEAKQLATAIASGETQTRSLSWQPWFLLLEEGPVTLDAIARLEEEWGTEATDKCSDLLFEARAYNIQFTFVAQSPFKDDHDFGRGKMQQFNYLVLGPSAVDTEVLSRIPGIGAGKAKSWVEKIERVREIKGCERACLVKLGQEQPAFSIRVVPEVNLESLKVELPPELYDTRPWLERTLTEEFVQQVEELTRPYAENKGRSPWKSVLELAGLGKNGQSRHPEEYAELRQWWESLIAELKNPKNDARVTCDQPQTRIPTLRLVTPEKPL